MARCPSDVNSASFAQWLAIGLLQANKELISTNGQAVLEGITLCARNGLPMPPWLARAYLERYTRFQVMHVRTVDEAFGIAEVTPQELAAMKQRKRLLHAVAALLVWHVKINPSRPITKALYADVADELGIGATLCAELYREGVRDHDKVDIVEMKAQLLRHPISSAERRKLAGPKPKV